MRTGGTPKGATARARPLPVIQGRAWLTQGRGHATGNAGTSLTHREALVSDAAHGEAVVAGVHSPGQHLVQVHVGALIQQRTRRTAHAQDQRWLPSLLPSGAAAAQGRQPRQRRAPSTGAAPLGPGAHPEPSLARPGGGGPAAGGAPRLCAHLSQSAQAQVKLGVDSETATLAQRPQRPLCPHTSGVWVPGFDAGRVA